MSAKKISLACLLLPIKSHLLNISIKTSIRGEIAHLVIDNTGLKVFGEGECKIRQHGVDKLKVWRKLYLAVDSATYEIVCDDLSYN